MVPPFIKNVLTLSIGTFLSQVLGFLFLPLLSRLYNPQEFGLFYTFTGITQTLGLFSTLKYEKSIILPEKKNDGDSLLLLTVFIIIIYSLVITLVFNWVDVLNIQLGEVQHIELIVPITILTNSTYSTLLQWYQREEQFKVIATLGVSQSICTFTCSIILSYVYTADNGLILGYILGYLLTMIGLIAWHFKRFQSLITCFDSKRIIENLKKYIDFPKYYLLYDLLTSGTVYIIPVIITTFYSKAECGLFSMAYRLLMVPVIVVSISISNVFLVNAKKQYISNKNFSELYKGTLFKVFFLAFLIYCPIYLFGGQVIAFFLGPEWSDIGIYINVVSVMLFFEFIVYVFRSNTYIVVQKQKIGLAIQICSTIVSFAMLLLLSDYGLIKALIGFTSSYIFFSSLTIYVTYKLSTG